MPRRAEGSRSLEGTRPPTGLAVMEKVCGTSTHVRGPEGPTTDLTVHAPV